MLTLNKWIFALIICFTIVKNSSGLSSNSSLRGHGDNCSTDSECASINGRCSDKQRCVCKPLYDFLFGKCTAVLGAHCEKPADCNIENVSCLDNKCFCPENMHLARNKTSCIKTAIALGDLCEQTGDCQKIKQSICSNSKCECVNNYFEQNKLCVKGIGADCTQDFECKVIGSECTEKKCHCLENMHLANNRSRCVRNAIAVFDYCEKNDDCKAIKHTSCLSNNCECQDPYFASNEQCVAELGTPCNKPTDCNIENVSCLGNRCSCPENMHLAVNKTSCIKNATAPLDYCEKDDDCKAINHTSCLDNKCKCKDQYFASNEQCVAKLGAPCNDPIDCNIDSVSCSEKKCSCPENMHLARNETSCIKNATALGDFCEQTGDCQKIEQSICSNSKCECVNNYFEQNKLCVKGIGADCTQDFECKVIGSECTEKKCHCLENMHLANNRSRCVRNAIAVFDYCEKNDDCKAIKHTSCLNNKCECQDPYFASNEQCVAELGTPCNKPTDCNIENVSCLGNRCSCPENMHLAVNKTSCIKNATALGDFCEKAEDCHNVMHSNCSSSECKCIKKYVEQDEQCIATIGTPCKQNEDCQLSNTVCDRNTCQCEKLFVELNNEQCLKISSYGNPCTDRKQCACENYPNCFLNKTYIDLVCSKKCECPKNYHYIPEKFSCVRTAEALNDLCDTDDNCKLLRYSICSNKKCACAENHFVQNEECVKGIGADCSHDSNCRVINSRCTTAKCRCLKNMHLALNKTSCIKNATVAFDFCEKDEDCSFIMHTSCIDYKCKCKDQYFASNDKCVAELGAPCNKPTDCNIENVSCSDKKCSCPENMHLAVNKTSCIKNAAALNDFCERNEDCNSIMHTNCEKHQCVCANNYSQKNGKCVGNLGASCSSSADCDTEKNSKCVDNKCVCIENYFLSDGRCKQGLNTHCSRDDDCSAVMNARCIKETCNCMAHNVQVSTERCMPVSFFNEECDYDVQCTELTPNAVCKSLQTADGAEGEKKKCQCSAGQHYQGNGCYAIKKLGENCDNLYECFVTSNPETVTCQGQCVCAEKYKKLNDTFCSGAESIVASILLIISMFTIKYIF
ncbi:prion-like-(Q/N-rich) domain-bearing protein 25 isoform X2 [Microplitis demolitor]|uniref:prion-like-(Q/N-rich) domain-bearing protein 25 isoform X2 n=1 Tax=Microplitis demolitor TaxID=69319 RepID=UPI00235B689B|nr:prion-like-(Q/N-rich) domain-bearing protein 25 isoform X2 [Microplitis demolitor]